MTLLPCDTCARHVRAGQPCPFCGAPARVAPAVEEAAPGPTISPSRASVMFGAAVGAIAISASLFATGCPIAAYGAPSPPEDAGPTDAGR